MADRNPYAVFLITPSRGYPGLPSIRPHPTMRIGDVETLQEYLHRSGFQPGDVVEMRKLASVQVIPPGQLIKRKRRDPNRRR